LSFCRVDVAAHAAMVAEAVAVSVRAAFNAPCWRPHRHGRYGKGYCDIFEMRSFLLQGAFLQNADLIFDVPENFSPSIIFLLQSMEKKIETNRLLFRAIFVRYRKFTPDELRLMRKSEGRKRVATSSESE
jgi:hypothetical protein